MKHSCLDGIIISVHQYTICSLDSRIRENDKAVIVASVFSAVKTYLLSSSTSFIFFMAQNSPHMVQTPDSFRGADSNTCRA